MKTLSAKWVKLLTTAMLMLAAGTAQAHTGHATIGFFEGLSHPLGLDHLLAMVAVGVWSVHALPAKKIWWGPATFLVVLVMSSVIGLAGFTVEHLEHAISLSVVIFGLMLIPGTKNLPVAGGLGLVALAASLHGLAHGIEAPGTGFIGYAAGFLSTTTVLHLSGVIAAGGIQRLASERKHWVTAGLGTLCSGAGIYLLQQQL